MRLRKALSELSDCPSVFIVSQRISSVASCDKILVTEDGALAGVGTHEELLASNDVYREIYSSQNGGAEK